MTHLRHITGGFHQPASGPVSAISRSEVVCLGAQNPLNEVRLASMTPVIIWSLEKRVREERKCTGRGNERPREGDQRWAAYKEPKFHPGML